MFDSTPSSIYPTFQESYLKTDLLASDNRKNHMFHLKAVFSPKTTTVHK